MKKLVIVFTAVFAVFFSVNGSVFAGGKADNATVKVSAELALVTDSGNIDDKSFNQGAWEGLVQYATENNIPRKYYQPSAIDDDTYLAMIDMAVTEGAKVVVTPGFRFETVVFVAQERYPDVMFILIDGTPRNAGYTQSKVSANTVSITYAEDQAGFLAGYSAVKDGYRKLGFIGGMAVPAVIRYGYGYVLGAEYAAKELGLPFGTVSVNYHYADTFNISPETQIKAAEWYASGVEIIFSAAGGAGKSVFTAAEQADRKAIGVDVDQSHESPAIITSAVKGIRVSVYDNIAAFYNGVFPGGQTLVFDAKNNGVGIPFETSKFTRFSRDDYNQIFALLSSGAIPRQMIFDQQTIVSVSALFLSAVEVFEDN
jgi:basic membrane protein A